MLVITSFVAASSSQGFTVTSVSLSNILHPGDPETSAQWLIQLSLNGGGQSIVGTLEKNDITYQGFTSVYPLQLTGKTDPEQAFYTINNNQIEPINTFTSVIQSGKLTSVCLGICHYDVTPAPDCVGQSIGQWTMKLKNGLWGASGDTIIGRLCFYSQQVGIKASIPATPNIQFSTHMNLLANGKQENIDLSYSQQSATSSGGLVQANWVGSLVTGNAPPNGNDYVAIANPQQSYWIVKPQVDFSNYKLESVIGSREFSADTVPAECSAYLTFPGINLIGGTDLQSYLTNYMNCLQTIATSKYSITNQHATDLLNNGALIGGKSAQLSDFNGQKAFLININDYFTTNPVVVLRLRGDFIGVVIPLGKPKILSATADCFNSGDKGVIKINVQNVGNSEGSFYADLSNCPIVSSQSQPKYSVGQGQTQTIELPIFSTGENRNANQQCNIKITDYNGGGTDSATVNICMKEANQCTPNTQSVIGKKICPCLEIGGVFKPATGNECTSCEYGVIGAGDGKFTCGAAPSIVANSNNGDGTSKLIQVGIDSVGNAHIPLDLGIANFELTLGSHAKEAAKNSNIAFPNAATYLIKGAVTLVANAGCDHGATAILGGLGLTAGPGGSALGVAAGEFIGSTISGSCKSFIGDLFNG